MWACLSRYLGGLALAAAVLLAPLGVSYAEEKGDAKKRTPVARPDHELVEVEDVFALNSGQFVVVLRTHIAPHRYLPVWIGETEALVIRLRLNRQKPPRPLTLNLLEQVMQSTNVELVEAAIDGTRGGVFLGRLKLRQRMRAFDVDARPSDAIGLALGSNAPIWVAKAVLRDSAFDPKDLEPGEQPPVRGEAPSPVGETL